MLEAIVELALIVYRSGDNDIPVLGQQSIHANCVPDAIPHRAIWDCPR